MPELPEVETIALALREEGHDTPPVVGRKIQGVRLLWKRTLATQPWEKWQSSLIGQSINHIYRRGKYLILQLSQNNVLFHLGMSGDLRVEIDSGEPAKHDRFLLLLEPDLRLVFNDPRKFGRVWLATDPLEVLSTLGPEPLNTSLTPQDFYRHIHQRKRQLKPLLIDQKFIAGLGNIYTDEALHAARLHPLTPAHTISQQQAEYLLDAIRQVLSEGIQRHGTSIDWVYQGGEFQNHLRVYQRTGEPCPTCSTPIERIIVAQRGTHYCPSCQPCPNNPV
ncbi:MAG: bifunctional DNA-formamidopyrimidine glycosylase/DNA-(apurinic or apyrimidinic site) lyase [Chloroflexota bacterium]